MANQNYSIVPPPLFCGPGKERPLPNRLRGSVRRKPPDCLFVAA
jgi:hypothetical protein